MLRPLAPAMATNCPPQSAAQECGCGEAMAKSCMPPPARPSRSMQMTVVWIRDAGNGGAGPDSEIGGGTAMEVAAHPDAGASGISPAPCGPGPAAAAPGSLRTAEQHSDDGAVCLIGVSWDAEPPFPADIPAAGKVAAGGNGSAAPDVGSSAAMELAARTGIGAPGTQPSLGSPEPTAGPTGNGMGGGGGPPGRRTVAGAGPDAAGACVGGAAGGEAVGGAVAVAGCGVAEPAAFFASAEAEADRRPRPAGEQNRS